MSKKTLICVVAAVAAVVVVAGVLIFKPSKEFKIAFYKIDEKQRQGITEVLSKAAADKDIAVTFIEYNSDKSLKEQIPLTKKPAIIITTSGFALETAVNKASKKAALPSSLRAALLRLPFL